MDFASSPAPGARQLSIERTPLPLPDVRLVDQDGHAFSLSSYKGRPVLVDFIYTRCPKMRLPVAGNRAKKIGASSGRCAACSATAQDTVRRMIPSGCHSHKHVK
jgi:hypothetical protein